MNFDETSDFQKDVKRLTKKYKSIPNDLKVFQRVVSHDPSGSNKKHFHILTQTDDCIIVKARFRCRYLRRQFLLRIIYAYHPCVQKIVFIELYFKGDKENPNEQRIQKYKEWNC